MFYNLIRRPKHTINLFAGYQLTKNLFISSSLHSFSERKDLYYNPSNFYTAEPKTLKAYALWNAYAEYSLEHNKLKLFVDAKNLTDKKDYYEVYGYNVQGLNVNGGVRLAL
jgi:vitamin B12 transporter